MARYEVWGTEFWDGMEATTVVFDGHPMDRQIGDWACGEDVPGFYCWARVAYYTFTGADEWNNKSIIMFSDPRAAMLFKLRWC